MSPTENTDETSVLKLTLHGRLVGYLAGFQNGRNVLSFADEFKDNVLENKFSLAGIQMKFSMQEKDGGTT